MTPREHFIALMREHHASLPLNYRDPEWQLIENEGYLRVKVPEAMRGGLRILEIGPGSGCTMLLLREAGNAVFGSDCIAVGGYVLAYSKITRALGLDVEYHGFHLYLRGEPVPERWPAFDLIYLRRSISSVLSDYGRDRYPEACAALLWSFHRLLAPGGIVHVDHNSGLPQEAWQAAVALYEGPLSVEHNDTRLCRLAQGAPA
jgi:SAM-dependent methyltransferase